MDKKPQTIAARFAHELVGPLGASLNSLEMTDHKLAEILGPEAKFFEAGIQASMSVKKTEDIPLPSMAEPLRKKLRHACEKNPEFLKLAVGLETYALERAIKIFEIGFHQKCARLGVESSQEIVKNIKKLDEENQSLEFKEVRLEESLQNAWALVAKRAKHIKLLWEIQPELAVHANAHALTQVWMNLILNAAQVNAHKCEMKIAANKTKNTIAIVFANTGKPLPKGLKLFQNGQTARKGGQGIGLYLCKQIITAHGGKISARSGKDNRGAIFKIELPIKKR